MKTDLAYINDTFQDVLEKAPVPFADEIARAERQSGITMIAGFPIRDREAQDSALTSFLDKRKKDFGDFIKQRAKVMDTLKARDVKPLAVLPSAAWEQICTKTGLYRMQPDSDGRIVLSNQFGNELTAEVTHLTNKTCGVLLTLPVLAGVAIVLAILANYHMLDFSSVIMGAALGVMGGALASLFLSALANLITLEAVNESFNDVTVGWWTRFLCACHDRKAPTDRMKRFMPGGFSRDTHNYDTPYATLVLPKPPQDVVDILSKLKTCGNLHLAALPEAFTFKETTAQLYGKQVARAAERDVAELWNKIIPDPIVYYENRGVVAILAQFGDFPIEKEVVDQVVNSEKLI